MKKWLCVTVYSFYIDISHNLTLLRGEITRLLKLLFKSCQNWKTCCQKYDEKSLKMVKYVDLDKKYYLYSGKLEYCIIIFYTEEKRYLFPSHLFFFLNILNLCFAFTFQYEWDFIQFMLQQKLKVAGIWTFIF